MSNPDCCVVSRFASQRAARTFCGPRTPRARFERGGARFADRAPLEFLQAERLEPAREMLVHALPGASVTEIAIKCGFGHLGRFSVAYRDRYGECPSATLRCARMSIDGRGQPCQVAFPARPAIAIFPLDLI
jgi:AraC-like DNA-binding protein